ncbi:DUF6631 family protein [Zestomonas carbonaria]|uniref:Uncharacterized protein n=1 Tax=Zestomonas carbonaria TaxID=2762745 RepID=A0A7U7ELI4_9GAMM|nr:DUF6631 family protein [Pseudomonas carbonaria]CAD5107238.1 hypothetical protein PSEWESI4_01509 [Pseudomonas carbonaria]
MAERVAKKKAAPDQGADDLQVLHPEVSLQVAGRDLVVREYGFIEGLGLRPRIQPLLDDLYELIQAQKLELEQIIVTLGRHHALVAELVAIAADVDVAWLGTLNQWDGQRLLMTWWGVNGPFYLRSLVERAQAERVEAEARRRVGATSTPPSSPADTEAPPPLA